MQDLELPGVPEGVNSIQVNCDLDFISFTGYESEYCDYYDGKKNPPVNATVLILFNETG